MPPPAHSTTIRFGPANDASHDGLDFALDVQRLELLHQGNPVDLRPQAIQALAVLLHHEGRLVTVEEFRLELWGDQYLEWRNSLHQIVRDLRRGLSDDARCPRFVATVARVGYRFVGKQARFADPGAADEASARSRRVGQVFRRPTVAFVAGVAVAALLPISLLIACAMLAG